MKSFASLKNTFQILSCLLVIQLVQGHLHREKFKHHSDKKGKHIKKGTYKKNDKVKLPILNSSYKENKSFFSKNNDLPRNRVFSPEYFSGFNFNNFKHGKYLDVNATRRDILLLPQSSDLNALGGQSTQVLQNQLYQNENQYIPKSSLSMVGSRRGQQIYMDNSLMSTNVDEPAYAILPPSRGFSDTSYQSSQSQEPLVQSSTKTIYEDSDPSELYKIQGIQDTEESLVGKLLSHAPTGASLKAPPDSAAMAQELLLSHEQEQQQQLQQHQEFSKQLLGLSNSNQDLSSNPLNLQQNHIKLPVDSTIAQENNGYQHAIDNILLDKMLSRPKFEHNRTCDPEMLSLMGNCSRSEDPLCYDNDLDAFRRNGLEQHKKLRTVHSSPTIDINEMLNQEAQDYSERLADAPKLAYSDPKNRPGQGENIAVRCSDDNSKLTAKEAVNYWYNKVCKDDFNFNQYSPEMSQFAQVVWKDTNFLGLGRTTRSKGDLLCTYIVARYSPQATKNGFLENVPRGRFNENSFCTRKCTIAGHTPESVHGADDNVFIGSPHLNINSGLAMSNDQHFNSDGPPMFNYNDGPLLPNRDRVGTNRVIQDIQSTVSDFTPRETMNDETRINSNVESFISPHKATVVEVPMVIKPNTNSHVIIPGSVNSNAKKPSVHENAKSRQVTDFKNTDFVKVDRNKPALIRHDNEQETHVFEDLDKEDTRTRKTQEENNLFKNEKLHQRHREESFATEKKATDKSEPTSKNIDDKQQHVKKHMSAAQEADHSKGLNFMSRFMGNQKAHFSNNFDKAAQYFQDKESSSRAPSHRVHYDRDRSDESESRYSYNRPLSDTKQESHTARHRENEDESNSTEKIPDAKQVKEAKEKKIEKADSKPAPSPQNVLKKLKKVDKEENEGEEVEQIEEKSKQEELERNEEKPASVDKEPSTKTGKILKKFSDNDNDGEIVRDPSATSSVSKKLEALDLSKNKENKLISEKSENKEEIRQREDEKIEELKEKQNLGESKDTKQFHIKKASNQKVTDVRTADDKEINKLKQTAEKQLEEPTKIASKEDANDTVNVATENHEGNQTSSSRGDTKDTEKVVNKSKEQEASQASSSKEDKQVTNNFVKQAKTHESAEAKTDLTKATDETNPKPEIMVFINSTDKDVHKIQAKMKEIQQNETAQQKLQNTRTAVENNTQDQNSSTKEESSSTDTVGTNTTLTKTKEEKSTDYSGNIVTDTSTITMERGDLSDTTTATEISGIDSGNNGDNKTTSSTPKIDSKERALNDLKMLEKDSARTGATRQMLQNFFEKIKADNNNNMGPNYMQLIPFKELHDFQQEITTEHNKYRQIHGVPLLSLDVSLSHDAQLYAAYAAKHATVEHSDPHERPDVGESVAEMCTREGVLPSAEHVVNKWYSEICNPGFDFTSNDKQPGTGHFTQIVWKDTSKIGVGFAVANHPNGDSCSYVVARYKNAGNYLDKFKENVQEGNFARSECNSNSADSTDVGEEIGSKRDHVLPNVTVDKEYNKGFYFNKSHSEPIQKRISHINPMILDDIIKEKVNGNRMKAANITMKPASITIKGVFHKQPHTGTKKVKKNTANERPSPTLHDVSYLVSNTGNDKDSAYIQPSHIQLNIEAVPYILNGAKSKISRYKSKKRSNLPTVYREHTNSKIKGSLVRKQRSIYTDDRFFGDLMSLEKKSEIIGESSRRSTKKNKSKFERKRVKGKISEEDEIIALATKHNSEKDILKLESNITNMIDEISALDNITRPLRQHGKAKKPLENVMTNNRTNTNTTLGSGNSFKHVSKDRKGVKTSFSENNHHKQFGAKIRSKQKSLGKVENKPLSKAEVETELNKLINTDTGKHLRTTSVKKLKTVSLYNTTKPAPTKSKYTNRTKLRFEKTSSRKFNASLPTFKVHSNVSLREKYSVAKNHSHGPINVTEFHRKLSRKNSTSDNDLENYLKNIVVKLHNFDKRTEKKSKDKFAKEIREFAELNEKVIKSKSSPLNKNKINKQSIIPSNPTRRLQHFVENMGKRRTFENALDNSVASSIEEYTKSLSQADVVNSKRLMNINSMLKSNDLLDAPTAGELESLKGFYSKDLIQADKTVSEVSPMTNILENFSAAGKTTLRNEVKSDQQKGVDDTNITNDELRRDNNEEKSAEEAAGDNALLPADQTDDKGDVSVESVKNALEHSANQNFDVSPDEIQAINHEAEVVGDHITNSIFYHDHENNPTFLKLEKEKLTPVTQIKSFEKLTDWATEANRMKDFSDQVKDIPDNESVKEVDLNDQQIVAEPTATEPSDSAMAEEAKGLSSFPKFHKANPMLSEAEKIITDQLNNQPIGTEMNVDYNSGEKSKSQSPNKILKSSPVKGFDKERGHEEIDSPGKAKNGNEKGTKMVDEDVEKKLPKTKWMKKENDKEQQILKDVKVYFKTQRKKNNKNLMSNEKGNNLKSKDASSVDDDDEKAMEKVKGKENVDENETEADDNKDKEKVVKSDKLRKQNEVEDEEDNDEKTEEKMQSIKVKKKKMKAVSTDEGGSKSKNEGEGASSADTGGENGVGYKNHEQERQVDVKVKHRKKVTETKEMEPVSKKVDKEAHEEEQDEGSNEKNHGTEGKATEMLADKEPEKGEGVHHFQETEDKEIKTNYKNAPLNFLEEKETSIKGDTSEDAINETNEKNHKASPLKFKKINNEENSKEDEKEKTKNKNKFSAPLKFKKVDEEHEKNPLPSKIKNTPNGDDAQSNENDEKRPKPIKVKKPEKLGEKKPTTDLLSNQMLHTGSGSVLNKPLGQQPVIEGETDRLTDSSYENPVEEADFEERPTNPTDLEQSALMAHNKLRKLHHARPLQLSKQLSEEAQAYAVMLVHKYKGTLVDSPFESRLNQGENLAIDCDVNHQEMSGEEATYKWYAEICEHGYDFNHPMITEGTEKFSQLIWKSSKYFGIGRMQTKRNGMTCTIVVARYQPKGNTPQEFQANIDEGEFDASVCDGLSAKPLESQLSFGHILPTTVSSHAQSIIEDKIKKIPHGEISQDLTDSKMGENLENLANSLHSQPDRNPSHVYHEKLKTFHHAAFEETDQHLIDPSEGDANNAEEVGHQAEDEKENKKKYPGLSGSLSEDDDDEVQSEQLKKSSSKQRHVQLQPLGQTQKEISESKNSNDNLLQHNERLSDEDVSADTHHIQHPIGHGDDGAGAFNGKPYSSGTEARLSRPQAQTIEPPYHIFPHQTHIHTHIGLEEVSDISPLVDDEPVAHPITEASPPVKEPVAHSVPDHLPHALLEHESNDDRSDENGGPNDGRLETDAKYKQDGREEMLDNKPEEYAHHPRPARPVELEEEKSVYVTHQKQNLHLQPEELENPGVGNINIIHHVTNIHHNSRPSDHNHHRDGDRKEFQEDKHELKTATESIPGEILNQQVKDHSKPKYAHEIVGHLETLSPSQPQTEDEEDDEITNQHGSEQQQEEKPLVNSKLEHSEEQSESPVKPVGSDRLEHHPTHSMHNEGLLPKPTHFHGPVKAVKPIHGSRPTKKPKFNEKPLVTPIEHNTEKVVSDSHTGQLPSFGLASFGSPVILHLGATGFYEDPGSFLRIGLSTHNKVRKIHGSPPLTIDPMLTMQAYQHAVELTTLGYLKHHGPETLMGQGENLFMGCYDGEYDISAEEAVLRWYAEVCHPGYCFNTSTTCSGTGHFSQVVWANSKKLGIAKATRMQNGLRCTYIVARYFPGGNENRHYNKNVRTGQFNEEKTCPDIFTSLVAFEKRNDLKAEMVQKEREHERLEFLNNLKKTEEQILHQMEIEKLKKLTQHEQHSHSNEHDISYHHVNQLDHGHHNNHLLHTNTNHEEEKENPVVEVNIHPPSEEHEETESEPVSPGFHQELGATNKTGLTDKTGYEKWESRLKSMNDDQSPTVEKSHDEDTSNEEQEMLTSDLNHWSTNGQQNNHSVLHLDGNEDHLHRMISEMSRETPYNTDGALKMLLGIKVKAGLHHHDDNLIDDYINKAAKAKLQERKQQQNSLKLHKAHFGKIGEDGTLNLPSQHKTKEAVEEVAFNNNQHRHVGSQQQQQVDPDPEKLILDSFLAKIERLKNEREREKLREGGDKDKGENISGSEMNATVQSLRKNSDEAVSPVTGAAETDEKQQLKGVVQLNGDEVHVEIDDDPQSRTHVMKYVRENHKAKEKQGNPDRHSDIIIHVDKNSKEPKITVENSKGTTRSKNKEKEKLSKAKIKHKIKSHTNDTKSSDEIKLSKDSKENLLSEHSIGYDKNKTKSEKDKESSKEKPEEGNEVDTRHQRLISDNKSAKFTSGESKEGFNHSEKVLKFSNHSSDNASPDYLMEGIDKHHGAGELQPSANTPTSPTSVSHISHAEEINVQPSAINPEQNEMSHRLQVTELKMVPHTTHSHGGVDGETVLNAFHKEQEGILHEQELRNRENNSHHPGTVSQSKEDHNDGVVSFEAVSDPHHITHQVHIGMDAAPIHVEEDDPLLLSDHFSHVTHLTGNGHTVHEETTDITNRLSHESQVHQLSHETHLSAGGNVLGDQAYQFAHDRHLSLDGESQSERMQMSSHESHDQTHFSQPVNTASDGETQIEHAHQFSHESNIGPGGSEHSQIHQLSHEANSGRIHLKQLHHGSDHELTADENETEDATKSHNQNNVHSVPESGISHLILPGQTHAVQNTNDSLDDGNEPHESFVLKPYEQPQPVRQSHDNPMMPQSFEGELIQSNDVTDEDTSPFTDRLHAAKFVQQNKITLHPSLGNNEQLVGLQLGQTLPIHPELTHHVNEEHKTVYNLQTSGHESHINHVTTQTDPNGDFLQHQHEQHTSHVVTLSPSVQQGDTASSSNQLTHVTSDENPPLRISCDHGNERHGGEHLLLCGENTLKPVSFEAPSTGDVSLFQLSALNSHNTYRQTHMVNPLKLNQEMSKEATEYAKRIAKAGSLKHSGTEDGENIATVCRDKNMLMTGQEASTIWYREVCDPGYDFIAAQPGKAGHFTQVIWKGSEEFGIGRAAEMHNGLLCTYIVARYRPAGNFIGEFAENVPRGHFNSQQCVNLARRNELIPNPKKLFKRSGIPKIRDRNVTAGQTSVARRKRDVKNTLKLAHKFTSKSSKSSVHKKTNREVKGTNTLKKSKKKSSMKNKSVKKGNGNSLSKRLHKHRSKTQVRMQSQHTNATRVKTSKRKKDKTVIKESDSVIVRYSINLPREKNEKLIQPVSNNTITTVRSQNTKIGHRIIKSKKVTYKAGSNTRKVTHKAGSNTRKATYKADSNTRKGRKLSPVRHQLTSSKSTVKAQKKDETPHHVIVPISSSEHYILDKNVEIPARALFLTNKTTGNEFANIKSTKIHSARSSSDALLGDSQKRRLDLAKIDFDLSSSMRDHEKSDSDSDLPETILANELKDDREVSDSEELGRYLRKDKLLFDENVPVSLTQLSNKKFSFARNDVTTEPLKNEGESKTAINHFLSDRIQQQHAKSNLLFSSQKTNAMANKSENDFPPLNLGGSLVVSTVRNLPAKNDSSVESVGNEFQQQNQNKEKSNLFENIDQLKESSVKDPDHTVKIKFLENSGIITPFSNVAKTIKCVKEPSSLDCKTVLPKKMSLQTPENSNIQQNPKGFKKAKYFNNRTLNYTTHEHEPLLAQLRQNPASIAIAQRFGVDLFHGSKEEEDNKGLLAMSTVAEQANLPTDLLLGDSGMKTTSDVLKMAKIGSIALQLAKKKALQEKIIENIQMSHLQGVELLQKLQKTKNPDPVPVAPESVQQIMSSFLPPSFPTNPLDGNVVGLLENPQADCVSQGNCARSKTASNLLVDSHIPARDEVMTGSNTTSWPQINETYNSLSEPNVNAVRDPLLSTKMLTQQNDLPNTSLHQPQIETYGSNINDHTSGLDPSLSHELSSASNQVINKASNLEQNQISSSVLSSPIARLSGPVANGTLQRVADQYLNADQNEISGAINKSSNGNLIKEGLKQMSGITSDFNTTVTTHQNNIPVQFPAAASDETNLNSKMFRPESINLPIFSPHLLSHVATERNEIDSEFEDATLNAHNAFRSVHDARPLLIDAKLSGEARERARQIAEFEQSTGNRLRDENSEGENIAITCKDAMKREMMTGPDAVLRWYDQVCIPPEYVFDVERPQKNAQEFQQVVWKETVRMGVGRSTFEKNGNYCTVIVARYFPGFNPKMVRGNVLQGSFEYNSYCSGLGAVVDAGENTHARSSASRMGISENTQDFRQEALNLQNEFRAVHGSPSMGLDDSLCIDAELYATELAKGGELKHGSTSDGESLIKSCNMNSNEMNADEAIRKWYNEVCNPGYSFISDTPAGGTTSFTQMVWKETSLFGIGKATTKEDGLLCTYVVGRYRERGNLPGGFKTNVPRGAFDFGYCESLGKPHRRNLVRASEMRLKTIGYKRNKINRKKHSVRKKKDSHHKLHRKHKKAGNLRSHSRFKSLNLMGFQKNANQTSIFDSSMHLHQGTNNTSVNSTQNHGNKKNIPSLNIELDGGLNRSSNELLLDTKDLDESVDPMTFNDNIMGNLSSTNLVKSSKIPSFKVTNNSWSDLMIQDTKSQTLHDSENNDLLNLMQDNNKLAPPEIVQTNSEGNIMTTAEKHVTDSSDIMLADFVSSSKMRHVISRRNLKKQSRQFDLMTVNTSKTFPRNIMFFDKIKKKFQDWRLKRRQQFKKTRN